jgi:hypothetical protein
VEQREQTGRHDAEHRHRLGDAIHRATEMGAEQEQHRRHERAAVRDADPEHEVGDVRRPHHRPRVAGDAEPEHDLVAERQETDGQHDQVEDEPRPPHRPRNAEQTQTLLVQRLLRQHRGVGGGGHRGIEPALVVTRGHAFPRWIFCL